MQHLKLESQTRARIAECNAAQCALHGNQNKYFQVFVLPVPDVHSILFISVFDEDKNHKTEFLGIFC